MQHQKLSNHKTIHDEIMEELPIFNEVQDDNTESVSNLTSQRTKAKKKRAKRQQLNRSATTPQYQRRNNSTAHKINGPESQVPQTLPKSAAMKGRGADRGKSSSTLGHQNYELEERKSGPKSFSARLQHLNEGNGHTTPNALAQAIYAAGPGNQEETQKYGDLTHLSGH